MYTYHEADRAALATRLSELKVLFDKQMKEGKNFDEVKRTYMQIKTLEAQLNVINWQTRKS